MSPRRFSRSRSGQPSKVTKSRLNFAVRHNQNRVALKSRDVNPLNPLHPTKCEPVSTVARLKSIRCPLAPWSTSRFCSKSSPNCQMLLASSGTEVGTTDNTSFPSPCLAWLTLYARGEPSRTFAARHGGSPTLLCGASLPYTSLMMHIQMCMYIYYI